MATKKIIIGGGGAASRNYEQLEKKPKINDIELIGNKTSADLGITGEGTKDYNDLINTPTFKTVNGEAIIGTGDIKTGSGDYNDLTNKPTFKTINNTTITGTGNIDTIPQLKTINKETITGTGDIDTTPDLKTIGGNSLLGTGDINVKTINNDSIFGTGNIALAAAASTDYNDLTNKPAFNGTELNKNSTLKTINKESLLGTGDIEIKGKEYIAGDNITIDSTTNKISASVKTYTAGDGINIDNTTNKISTNISKDLSTYDNTTSKFQNDTEVNKLITDAIGKTNHISVSIVTAKPTSNIKTDTLYLIKDTADTNSNIYEQWMYIDDTWASLGTTEVDLSNYQLKLTAGDNISIDATNKISADFPIKTISINGTSNVITPDENKNIDVVLTAGSGININKNIISLSSEFKLDTLVTTSWNNNVYSFETSYPFSKYDIEIEPNGDTITKEQYEAWSAAELVGSNTSNQVKALGTVPLVNIPIIVKAVNKNAIG